MNDDLDRKVCKKDCIGCYDNNYNYPPWEGCWLSKSAKLVRRKKISNYDRPPWDWQPIVVVPNCYHQSDFVFVGERQEY